MRTCKSCGIVKEICEFRLQKIGPNGPLHSHVCKACARDANKAWRASNKERLAEYDKSRQTPERRAACIKWQHDNRDKLREYSRGRSAAAPWVAVNHAASRRARLAQATPPWSDKNACGFAYVAAKMFEKSFGGKWTVDHVVPLKSDKVCGLHVPWNLVLAPHSDNCAKGNRWWPDAW